jgi:hypothetical protein
MKDLLPYFLPTNLTQSDGALLVAEGMGTPGRLIPGAHGRPVALTGFIERIALPSPTAASPTP